jgi:hypothetical protein
MSGTSQSMAGNGVAADQREEWEEGPAGKARCESLNARHDEAATSCNPEPSNPSRGLGSHEQCSFVRWCIVSVGHWLVLVSDSV